MQYLIKHHRSIGIAVLMVLLNLLLVSQIAGLSYASYSWTNFARVYTGSISGVVTSSDGVVSGVRVYLYDSRGRYYGWTITNSSGAYSFTGLSPASNYKVYFSDRTGTYLREWYQNTLNSHDAEHVSVMAGQVTWVNIWLIKPHEAANPLVDVTVASGRTWADPHTGQVSIGLYGRSNFTLSHTVSCIGGGTPTGVKLVLNSQEYPMSDAGGGTYSVAVNGSTLPSAWTMSMKVVAECPGGTQETDVGTVYIDPSGYVTDAVSGEPIEGATVTLYKDERVPDDTGPVDLATECPTINTRPDPNWFSGDLPTATVDPAEEGDPTSGLFLPAENPLTTDPNGYYRWDVAEGCWYVQVEADNYYSKVSPVVGVVEGAPVTDLNFQLQHQGIYLPLIIQSD